MKTRTSVLWILWIGALLGYPAFAADEARPLSPEERDQMERLADQFDIRIPEMPTALLQRDFLRRLLDYVNWSLVESETLVVCDVIEEPHLEIGDEITLRRIGSSGNLRMVVVRDKGLPTESHPWTNPSGGNEIIVNPAFLSKSINPSDAKFAPEGVGEARIDPHDGGAEDHGFSMRRETKATSKPNCYDVADEVMVLFVPPHESGGRHGGHAVAN